jgi:hypothetical protein
LVPPEGSDFIKKAFLVLPEGSDFIKKAFLVPPEGSDSIKKAFLASESEYVLFNINALAERQIYKGMFLLTVRKKYPQHLVMRCCG